MKEKDDGLVFEIKDQFVCQNTFFCFYSAHRLQWHRKRTDFKLKVAFHGKIHDFNSTFSSFSSHRRRVSWKSACENENGWVWMMKQRKHFTSQRARCILCTRKIKSKNLFASVNWILEFALFGRQTVQWIQWLWLSDIIHFTCHFFPVVDGDGARRFGFSSLEDDKVDPINLIACHLGYLTMSPSGWGNGLGRIQACSLRH